MISVFSKSGNALQALLLMLSAPSWSKLSVCKQNPNSKKQPHHSRVVASVDMNLAHILKIKAAQW